MCPAPSDTHTICATPTQYVRHLQCLQHHPTPTYYIPHPHPHTRNVSGTIRHPHITSATHAATPFNTHDAYSCFFAFLFGSRYFLFIYLFVGIVINMFCFNPQTVVLRNVTCKFSVSMWSQRDSHIVRPIVKLSRTGLHMSDGRDPRTQVKF